MEILKYGNCLLKRGAAFVASKVESIEDLLDKFYPVGTYYVSMSESFDPNESFVGTWVRDTDGLVTVAATTAGEVGQTGGEETHTITVAEMPSHKHTSTTPMATPYNTNSYGNTTITSLKSYSTTGTYNGTVYNGTLTSKADGTTAAHNNIQPSIICNRWHRTA